MPPRSRGSTRLSIPPAQKDRALRNGLKTLHTDRLLVVLAVGICFDLNIVCDVRHRYASERVSFCHSDCSAASEEDREKVVHQVEKRQRVRLRERLLDMNARLHTRPLLESIRGAVAILCVVLLLPGDLVLYAQSSPQQDASQDQSAPKIPNDQLDSLVAPIALYPDPLLARFSLRPSILWRSFSSNSGWHNIRI